MRSNETRKDSTLKRHGISYLFIYLYMCVWARYTIKTLKGDTSSAGMLDESLPLCEYLWHIRNDIYIYIFFNYCLLRYHMGMGQILVPQVNINVAGEWMFIPLEMFIYKYCSRHGHLLLRDPV